MRRLIILVFLLAAAAPVKAQITAGNACNAGQPAATMSVTCTISTTKGQELFMMEANGTALTDNSLPTDSANNSCWTLVGSTTNGAVIEVSLYKCENSSAVTQISCNWAASVTNTVCIGFAVSGLAPSNSQDGSGVVGSIGTVTNGSPGQTSGSLTTTNPNDILIYVVRTGTANITSWSAGSGYTVPTNGSTLVSRASLLQYKIVSAPQSGVTTNCTESGSGTSSFTTVFAAFKAKAPAPAVVY